MSPRCLRFCCHMGLHSRAHDRILQGKKTTCAPLPALKAESLAAMRRCSWTGSNKCQTGDHSLQRRLSQPPILPV